MNRILSNTKHERLFSWIKLISITGGAQVVVQLISLISGIFVIRMLPAQEYALYTLANTMLGTMALLSDSGVSNSVLAQGGQVWNDRTKLGVVLSTGMELRKVLSIGGCIIVVPVLMYMLHNNGASWLMSSIITLSLIPAFIFALTGGLLEISLKLNQNIVTLQRIQIESNLGRLVLLCITIFIFPWAFVVIIGAAIAQLWTNIRLRKISGVYADLSQAADPGVKEAMTSVVKRILPTSIYYSFSGQISIWLISLFGSTIFVAQLGALGRLSMMLTIFNVMYGILVIPRLAKLPNERKILMKRFLQTQIFLLLFYSLIIFSVWLLSDQLLWILGSKYQGLNEELVLSVTGSCVGIFSGASFVFYTSRGWAMNPIVVILFDLTALVIGVFLFNVSTLQGVLGFGIFMAAMLWALNFVYSIYKINRIES